jgi:hypothetical protein
MFLDELSPLFQELVNKPVAFAGGFVSGLLRLNLNDEPVSKWLEKQMGVAPSAGTPPTGANNSRSSGPQSINID